MTPPPGRRSIGRLLVGYSFASLANGLPWPLLLVLVWEQYADGPHGAWAVGLAGAARMAPYVLLSWAVASLGDHGRRDLLVRASLALRVFFLGAAALAVGADRVGLAVVAAGLSVAVGTPAYPAIAAALPRLAGPDRVRATELLVTIEVSSWVVGPALGGLMLATAARPWTLPVAVALALVAWLLVVGIDMPGPEHRAPDAVAGMLRAVLSCRPAVAALGLAALINLVETTAGLSLLPLSRETWDQGAAGFGMATACLGFGALGAPVLSRLFRTTSGRGLALLAMSLALVAATPLPALALPLLVVAGAAGVVVEALVTATLQEAVPDQYRAGALGLADTVMVAACLVGSLAAPLLAAAVGGRAALAGAALVGLVPAALAVRARRRGGVRPALDVPADETSVPV